MSNLDYSQFTGPENSGDNSMAALRDLATQQHEAELEVSILEEKLVAAKDRLRVISEVRLPELMDELGIPSFDTTDGLHISVKETTFASMGRSPEEKAVALDWLEENGHGHLIKRTVEVPFSKGQDAAAIQLASDLVDQGRRASFTRKVEPMTLKAFVVERLETGADIPLDIFKVERKRSTKVEL